MMARTRWVLVIVFAALLVGLGSWSAGDSRAEERESERYFFPFVASIPSVPPAASPLYGVNFITSAEDPADARQYQNGLATGAGWNRWPIYWFNVETAPDQFDWAAQDAALAGDVAHGLRTNGILLGTPSFYLTGDAEERAEPAGEWMPRGNLSLRATETATPAGLYQPIFTDGSDVPGPGKQINPANVWARFVHAAVQRYRPDGVLAQHENWPAGAGITHWEMWNEPDLASFWDGTLADYARLLKVGYLAARHADSGVQILFGGLANNFELLNYYRDVLAIYAADPLATQFDYYHDIVATHSYFYAWQSWYHVYRAQRALDDYGLDKPIWLNESGVPAWDDYPGPVWDPNSALRATMQEQADYVIQSAFYATYAGADAIFHFQLYDGCGNQPRYTDFPPHNGELCDANGNLITDPTKPCAGDANGLFRNSADAACFTQHPQPETARLNYDAYRVLTTHLRGVEPYWRLRPGSDDPYDGPQEWIAFYQPQTGKRILGLWARTGAQEVAVLPATAATALLVRPDGSIQSITPVNGAYTLTLPGATNQNAFWDPSLYPIGGSPLILIEADPSQVGPPTGHLHPPGKLWIP